MNRKVGQILSLFAFLALSWPAGQAFAQVTTGSITGTVTGPQGPVVGAAVIAVHEPSGTRYGGITRNDGRFAIPGMRVGGPYTVTISSIGFQNIVRSNLNVSLGTATPLSVSMQEQAVAVEGIEVTAEQEAIMSPDRTGAATAVSREAIATLPTISRRIEDFARLTPQYSGASFGFSFAGQDNRLNNMTVDGSYFNNSFGLSGQPGDRTGVSPISIDAIEQVQINVAPYDVRQGNFVGAGVNTVTRSGTNDFRGSLYYQFRDQDLVGEKAKALTFNPGTFDFSQIGGWLSGPIIKNKMFFFGSIEREEENRPLTNFVANAGGETVQGNTTRVLRSDLETLSTFLRTNFGYETGPFEGYQDVTPGNRYLAKLDYNVNSNNKLSLRYNHLDSQTDVIMSSSSSLGLGRGTNSTNYLSYQNSNYQILENIRSVVGEWNSVIGSNMSNNLIVGYTYQDESRASRGTFFPLVDVLNAPGGTAYTGFGFEPFTPNNELRYKSFQVQNNFTRFSEKHTLTFGVSGEFYKSENVFFPGSQSAYVYNSLADFYADANNFISVCGTNQANWDSCVRTTSPVTLRRFQVRYANQPGMEKPIQPLEVFFGGIYGQDEFQVNDKLKLTAGLRIDMPVFGNTAFANTAADALNFRDETGATVKYQSGELPDPKPLWSPRVGFNFDVTGERTTQIRGGTGVFTGRPAYVWISNQIGNTGVLTGFEELNNTTTRPFHPNPNRYKPTNVTGAPASTYELALTDPDFKFPQVWRSNIALDQRLPWGVIGTGEFLYTKDVNGVYYINANLPAAQGTITDAAGKTRPRWTGTPCTTPAVSATRINCNVANAIVLKNQDEGFSWNASGSLEKAFDAGLYLKAGYMWGVSKNTVDPGSIAFGSWSGNANSGDPNNPGLGYSAYSPGNRLFLAASFRRDFFGFGETGISIFAERRTNGSSSMTLGSDLNGDGSVNDLIYVPKDASEMRFVTYTQNASGSIPAEEFTVQEQIDAFEKFLSSHDDLNEQRGDYVERNSLFVPEVFRVDLSFTQDLAKNLAGIRNGLQFRVDVLNFTNLLNSDWGVGQRFTTTQPLTNPTIDAAGNYTYRMRNVARDGKFQLYDNALEQAAGINDVYRVQFTLKYMFN